MEKKNILCCLVSSMEIATNHTVYVMKVACCKNLGLFLCLVPPPPFSPPLFLHKRSLQCMLDTRKNVYFTFRLSLHHNHTIEKQKQNKTKKWIFKTKSWVKGDGAKREEKKRVKESKEFK